LKSTPYDHSSPPEAREVEVKEVPQIQQRVRLLARIVPRVAGDHRLWGHTGIDVETKGKVGPVER